MILWEKSDCSPDWTELLSILADLAKLTEKCSKNCGLIPHVYEGLVGAHLGHTFFTVNRVNEFLTIT